MTPATAEAASERFIIDPEEMRRRWIRVGWGLLFSAAIIAVVGFDYERDPQPSTRALLWSVTLVLSVANIGNLGFLLRYRQRIQHHYLELAPGRLRFVTAAESSELALEQVAAIRLFSRRGRLQHIQLLLRNNRGIRLEGYRDLPRLAELLQHALPASKLLR